MTKRCICEICTCGRHRCPHRPQGTIQKGFGPCHLSEYANKYKGYPGAARRDNFKPKEEMIKGAGPMDGTTTHKKDFIPHPFERPYVHQGEEYQPLPGDMDMLTSYTRDYPGKRAIPAKSAKNLQTRKVPLDKFEADPTYKTDYRKWDIPARDLAKGHHVYRPPSAPFEGQTTFQRDFQPKRVPLTQSMRPNETAAQSDTPFDDRTSHRLAYVAHPHQPRFVRTPENYKQNPNRFDGLTTHKRDFIEKQAPKPESFKPSQAPLHSDHPFDDGTTFRRDYKAWEVRPPQVHVPDEWVKPKGDIDTLTTFRRDYPAHHIQPSKAARPPSRSKFESGPFDDRTNYKTDFRPWDSRPDMRGDPSRKPYERPSVPFEGLSNYQMHYVPKAAPPPRSFAPDRGAQTSDTPFDDRTMYKSEYIPKEADLCPAIDLNRSGFRFKEIDARGHEVWGKNGYAQRAVVSPQISMETAQLA
ncbi:stabilizer of axonemal microtubules 2-like [Ptychodera flava]|uniref:stabilizer of axonemal microtubules 2-like n=1 Tax=Ptychodera flava TaxID=63121 RepID=UPI003969D558